MVLSALRFDILGTEQGEAGKPNPILSESPRLCSAHRRQAFDVNQANHVSSFEPKMMEINVPRALPVSVLFLFFFNFPLWLLHLPLSSCGLKMN